MMHCRSIYERQKSNSQDSRRTPVETGTVMCTWALCPITDPGCCTQRPLEIWVTLRFILRLICGLIPLLCQAYNWETLDTKNAKPQWTSTHMSKILDRDLKEYNKSMPSAESDTSLKGRLLCDHCWKQSIKGNKKHIWHWHKHHIILH